jgi:hypothetical protein
MFDSSNDRVELRVDPIASGAVVYGAEWTSSLTCGRPRFD